MHIPYKYIKIHIVFKKARRKGTGDRAGGRTVSLRPLPLADVTTAAAAVALLGGGWAIVRRCRRHHRVDVSTIRRALKQHAHIRAQWRPKTTVTSTRICPRHLRNACGTRSPMRLPELRILKLLDSDSPGSRPANVTVSVSGKTRRADASAARRPANMADIFPVCVYSTCIFAGACPPLTRPPTAVTSSFLRFLFHGNYVISRLFQVLRGVILLSIYGRCR